MTIQKDAGHDSLYLKKTFRLFDINKQNLMPTRILIFHF
jgi:hypothetical protein